MTDSVIKDLPNGLPVYYVLEVCNVTSSDHRQNDLCELVTRFCPDLPNNQFSVGLRHHDGGFFQLHYRDTLGEIIATRNLMIELRRKELGFA